MSNTAAYIGASVGAFVVAVCIRVAIYSYCTQPEERRVIIHVVRSNKNSDAQSNAPVETTTNPLSNEKQPPDEKTTLEQASSAIAPTLFTPNINALPEGWEELRTEGGEVFYASIYHDETTWDRPTQPAKKPVNKKSARVLFRPVETTM
jgi:hypothetical protein